jgi:hypothetical protein
MSLTQATPLILQDPGFLFWAPLLTTEPTHAAAGSTYDADVWPVAWIPLGATEDGSQFSYQINAEAVYVAEFLDPVRWSTVSRAGSFSFNLANYTLKNLSRAYNGGTFSTVSGTGATLSTKLLPPSPGSEVRAMIGWESLDHTMRIVAYQCLNSGTVASAYKKPPAYAVAPCMFNFEVPPGAPQQPFAAYVAGVGRLGV